MAVDKPYKKPKKRLRPEDVERAKAERLYRSKRTRARKRKQANDTDAKR